MAIVTKTRTYNDGDALPANYYNMDRDEMIAGINSIDNAQVSPTAGILESKLLFNGTSGHDHSGGVNGKPVNLSSASLATIGVAGLTAGYPVAINDLGTAVITRLLDNDDIDPAAGIEESKITFDAISGHIHDGSFSRRVPVVNLDPVTLTPLEFVRVNAGGTALETAPVVGGSSNRGYGFYWPDAFVSTLDTVAWNPIVIANATVIRMTLHAKVAPVGDDAIFTVYKNGATQIGTITLPDGTNDVTTTIILNPALIAGDYLQMYCSQGGTTTRGSGASIVLECTEP